MKEKKKPPLFRNLIGREWNAEQIKTENVLRVDFEGRVMDMRNICCRISHHTGRTRSLSKTTKGRYNFQNVGITID